MNQEANNRCGPRHWRSAKSRVGLLFLTLLVASPLALAQQPEPRLVAGLQLYVAALKSSTDDWPFLVIQVTGSDDFLQFANQRGTIVFDFPVVTDRQRVLKPKVEALCEQMGVSGEAYAGADGSWFLNYQLDGEPQALAETIATLLGGLYGVTSIDSLGFSGQGLGGLVDGG